MMDDAPTTFPLSWPPHKPRTDWRKRKNGLFKQNDRPINREQAVRRVQREVELLGGRHLIVSTDVPIRRDGMPYSNRSQEPTDPGACVYFHLHGKPYAMACDTFDKVAQNIAAVAGHIEATRKIERYGVATAAETLQAFTALPAPLKPHQILGVQPDADAETIRRAWRAKIATAHPDQSGTHAAAAELNAARDAMLKANMQ